LEKFVSWRREGGRRAKTTFMPMNIVTNQKNFSDYSKQMGFLLLTLASDGRQQTSQFAHEQPRMMPMGAKGGPTRVHTGG
jgi:hypothetical protein